MWFIGVEVEQETSAPPPEKNPGSAPQECTSYSAASTAVLVHCKQQAAKCLFLLSPRPYSRITDLSHVKQLEYAWNFYLVVTQKENLHITCNKFWPAFMPKPG